LDIACGPGTNLPLFADCDYTGVDLNAEYLNAAQQKGKGRFIHADATQVDYPTLGRFDVILMNSFLHHLPDADVKRVLISAAAALTEDGRIHILELVLPKRPSMARFLARADRGKFARPIDEWEQLFGGVSVPEVTLPYEVGLPGWPLWHMWYWKGKRKM
jgi:SAM-dependent methyltransferase